MLTVDIQECYPNAQFSVSGSVTKTKPSFHLVATNYIIKDESQEAINQHKITDFE